MGGGVCGPGVSHRPVVHSLSFLFLSKTCVRFRLDHGVLPFPLPLKE